MNRRPWRIKKIMPTNMFDNVKNDNAKVIQISEQRKIPE